MRFITGDECGLLKEVIPELCRPLGRDGDPSRAIHAGRGPRPSATSIQAAAASYGNYGVLNGGSANAMSLGGRGSLARAVRRLEPDAEAQGRRGGIVSLALLPSGGGADDENDGGGSSSFHFAALRMNGGVETWSADRQLSGDEREVNVTAATYRKVGGLTETVLQEGDDGAASSSHISDNDEDGSQSNNNGSRGWHTNQPIRPVGMSSNCKGNNNSQHKNPILATCDSIGNISLIDPRKLSSGIVARYNAFDVDAKSLPSPSSSKNFVGDNGARGGGGGGTVLTYTKGGFANAHIATCVAVCSGGERL
eukprot:CAMPEP_0172537268 /NCGR_PEP_ID=MMETSP1067-20121228/8896_1 /TAXON_ID=265564 ORGANISM="Thalassiosira punctigera, Strain Tpunct2005C2" /NCGR_SAMPLE_ID=MMETSP1067 /ASSEMBLY_ACC=CAM_ASM_000444 /LENGTH=308 /DNA_ID=CAMNT_0013322531 /DNA_START=68 /DNA_END=991 /DNA_ORIENTATION=-